MALFGAKDYGLLTPHLLEKCVPSFSPTVTAPLHMSDWSPGAASAEPCRVASNHLVGNRAEDGAKLCSGRQKRSAKRR